MGLRIALTHAFCWPEVRRGGERFLHELAAALSRRGHRVTIIAGASRWSLRREEGVKVLRVQRSARGGALAAERRFGFEVVPLLAAGRFDVVHSLGARDACGALIARRVKRHRTVYTCLGVPFGHFYGRPDAAAHLRVVDEIDVYGCFSRYAQACLQKDFGRRGALTPGGVRLSRFQPAPRNQTPVLLYSGALDDGRKGIPTLLEALAILAKAEPRLRLWLVGTGDPTRLLEDAPLSARERTDWLGVASSDEDLSQRYGAAWGTVLPSTVEAFGLVMVESLASGTPIVASDDAALPELVEPGVGALAAPGDPEALADACRLVLELATDASTVERCRGAARKHDWDEIVAPAIEALYLGSSRDSGA